MRVCFYVPWWSDGRKSLNLYVNVVEKCNFWWNKKCAVGMQSDTTCLDKEVALVVK